ncbi:MAG: DUF3048 domain-containing protein [Candidatus Woesebacteria bacterium]|jgi:hypothetical protein
MEEENKDNKNDKSKGKFSFFSSKKFMLILSFLGLYLLSSGTSWALFTYLKEDPKLETVSLGDLEEARMKISQLPKTQECPINGGMFTEPEEKIWQTRRPITVIVENHEDSRPPSGLSRADVVYEIVAEGGITRFLAVYYCGAAAEEVKVAPVRSARVYFIDYASEYGDFPIFMHVGGANDYAGFGDTARDARALELLETIGWRVPKGNDFDTTYDSGFPVFWRNYERLGKQVATEHTMMASLDAAYQQAEDRGFSAEDEDGDAWDENFVKWDFSGEGTDSDTNSSKISFEFWEDGLFSSEYAVTWVYDEESNSYKRENGGESHNDLETGEQLTAKNVVVLFARQRGPVDRNKHLLYETVGEGDALIFQNGKVVETTWEKDSRSSRTIFYDEDGAEVSFVGGSIWIEVLPAGNDVEY